jgi:hypothetical protein
VNGEVALEEGSYCWSSPTPNAQGSLIALCADKLAPDPDPVLVVNRGETLTLRFATTMAPTEVTLGRGTESTPLVAGNPVRFGSDLPAGTYVVRFSSKWLQGSASHAVRLDVRAAAGPATPTRGGNLTLTG